MNFTLNVLGTASAKPTANRFSSAQVLDIRGRLILIDCGEGTQMRIAGQHLSYLKIETICISHIHGDHIFGLFGLLSTMGLYGRKTPLKIFGPKAVGDHLKFYLSYSGGWLGFDIDFTAVSCKGPEKLLDAGFFEIFAFPLKHGIETYGYLIREKQPPLNIRKESIDRYKLTIAEIAAAKRGEDIYRESGPDCEPSPATDFKRYSGTDEPMLIPNSEITYIPFSPRSYAYCSDTASFPELAEWVSGVSVLYHESTYLKSMVADAIKRGHSTAEQAAQCAKAANVGKLLLGHYSSRVDNLNEFLTEAREVFPESYLTRDGDVVEILYIRNE